MIFKVGPQLSEGHPEEPVHEAELRAWRLPPEDGELLSQGEVLEGELVRAEDRAQGAEQRDDEAHRASLANPTAVFSIQIIGGTPAEGGHLAPSTPTPLMTPSAVTHHRWPNLPKRGQFEVFGTHS